jgi:tetratricopeptide (TPR) repeat protein
MVQLKDLPGALERSREALAIYEALVAADPADVGIRRNLAVGYRNVGVALGTTDPAEALRSFQRAGAIFEELVGKDPKNDDFRRQWAFTYLSQSRFQLETGDLENAVASALAGIRIADALVIASPANASAKNTLALLYLQMGSAHTKGAAGVDTPKSLQAERWRNAKEAFTRGLALLQEMKASGTLSAADGGKLEEAAKGISNCDTALKLLESASTAP